MKIPISKPWLGPEEITAVQAPIESGWVVQGPHVKAFEDKFAAFTKIPFAAATTSCTTALHMALVALGVEPGDEVIVPAFTWVATANVVEYMGAKPIFCDIDLQTFNIDVKRAASLVTPKTVGILPVHLFGLSADMTPLLQLAKRHKLWIIEDAACGFGASYHGKHVGAFGEIGCFSFHPRKSITTGEGGMTTTANADLDAKLRSLRDHGASKSDLARHEGSSSFMLPEFSQVGYNYRMTDIQGAMGSTQMDKASRILECRRSVARRYDKALSALGWLRPPVTPSGYEHGYQAYVSLFAPEEPTLKNVDTLYRQRNALMTELEKEGIATRPGTHAPPFLDFYHRKYNTRPEQYPNAYVADRLSIAIPLYSQLSEGEQDFICHVLAETKTLTPKKGKS